MDTIMSINMLLFYHSVLELKLNNEYKLKMQTFSINLREFTFKLGKRFVIVLRPPGECSE